MPGEAYQPLILRVYPGEGADQKMIREASGLHQLQQAGYPAPGMFLYETDSAILGKPFTIIEKLTGRPLWPVLMEEAPERVSQLLGRFSRLLRQLHQLDWHPFSERSALYEANPTAILDELCAWSRQLYMKHGVEGFLATIDWLEEHKTEIRVQPAVVHLDFHANNVFLCDDEQMKVIDWTQICVSDYRLDLTWTLLIMGDYGQAQWGDRILQAYLRAPGRPIEDLDYFNVFTYTKLIASTVISSRTSPTALGMRLEKAESIKRKDPILRKLTERIKKITGITVPEWDEIC